MSIFVPYLTSDVTECTQYAQFNDITTPTNPLNGQGKLYKKNGDPGLYWLPDSGGIETNLVNGEFSASTITLSAAPVVISSIVTVSDHTYLVECKVVAMRTDSGTESAGYVYSATYRNNAGVLTKVADTLTSQEDIAGWTFTTVVSGININLRVSGAAGATISWVTKYTILSV
jgi:hypothetical protein